MIKRLLSILSLAVFCLYVSAQDIVPKHNDKGQFGYGIKGSKEFTIKPQWDEAKPFNDEGVAIVRKGDMYGFIDRNGKPIGKSMGYSLIAPFDGTDYWLVALGGKRVEDSNKIKNRVGLSPYGFKGSLSYPISGAEWGLVRQNGKPQIEPQYKELSSIMPGELLVFQNGKGLYGFVNLEGRVVFEAIYDVVTPFNEQGIAAVRTKKGGLWSVINKNGSTIIGEDKGVSAFGQFRNDYLGTLNSLSADSVLRNKELWNGQHILPIMNFSSSWINSEQPYIVGMKVYTKKKEKTVETAVFDLSGNVLIPFSAGLTGVFVPSDNMAVAVRGNQCGLYNVPERTFIPLIDRFYLPFKEGHSLSYAIKDNKVTDFYLIDKKGNKTSNNFEEVQIVNDRYVIRQGNKYGLISMQGEEIVPTECMVISDGGDGLFGVRESGGSVGYLDKNANTVIPFEYAEGSQFVNGYAIVSKKVEGSFKKHQGVINKTNEVVLPIEFDKVCGYVSAEGALSVWVSNNSDVYSAYDLSTGKQTPTVYTEMKNVGVGIVVKNEENRYGLLINGTEAIPCSVATEELVQKVYSYMNESGINNISSLDAHVLSVWLNEARNTFKLSDKISDNFWDF